MAKSITAPETLEEATKPSVYFQSLHLEDVKCFKGSQVIDFSDGNNKPAQWTVILGNNNTGKTTILKCLAAVEPTLASIEVLGNKIDVVLPSLFRLSFIEQINANFFYLEKKNTYKKLKEHKFDKLEEEWIGAFNMANTLVNSPYSNLIINSYGVHRKSSHLTNDNFKPLAGNLLFFEEANLMNCEEWLLELFLSEKLGKKQAGVIFKQVEKILTSGILPDIKGLQVKSIEKGASFENLVEFDTDFGKARLRDLGYGYQSMAAWVLDLVRRMVERYSDYKNPLEGPAVVLVDEIDLHLHPEWQRKIVGHLSKYFPNTQFIVTAHSPLIVQSAEQINLVLLEKEEDTVTIRQPKIGTYRGWSVEEILRELMNLGERVQSDYYLELMHEFEARLEEDNYEKAEAAFDKLNAILPVTSGQRKILRIQLAATLPA